MATAPVFGLPSASQGASAIPTSTQTSSPTTSNGFGITPKGQGLLNAIKGQVPTSVTGITPTPSGGTAVPKTMTSGISAAPHPSPTPTASLADYLSNTSQTPGGGSITASNSGVSNYTPAPQYNIDTNSPITSDMLGKSTSMADVMQKHSQYQDYVNGLAQAQGYNPQYIQALQAQQGAQAQGAQLGLNAAELNSNLFTGRNLPGDTMQYAQGATAKAQAQNTLEQAGNQIQQLSANQALNTAQLARTGNISAAQTQLQYSPEGRSGANALDQYNALQQSYPGAQIPEYNPTLTPQQNQQIAQYIVSNSPAYKAGFQSTYTTPGGGTGIYSKLDVGSGGLQHNQDGSYTLVPAAAAALGSANADVVSKSLNNLSTINAAIESSSKTLDTTTQFMKQYGLNETNIPLVTQIQNKIKDQTTQRGAIAGLNADLNTLRSDYSQFLIGRGGSIAGTGPNSPEVMQAIPDNISAAQLQVLVGQMKQDGQNTADAVANQVNHALQGIQGGGSSLSSGSHSTGGSIWSF